jgi:hypothetical protein
VAIDTPVVLSLTTRRASATGERAAVRPAAVARKDNFGWSPYLWFGAVVKGRSASSICGVARKVCKLVRGSRGASRALGSSLVAVGRGRGCLLWTFVYLVVRNLFALAWLLARRRRSKELEIGVPRTQAESRGGRLDLSAAVLCRRWGFGPPESPCRGRLQTTPRCGG